MAKKVTITLDNDILTFIDRRAASLNDKANRSGYINGVLAAQTIASLKQDAKDVEYQAEVVACDCMAGAGIDAEGF